MEDLMIVIYPVLYEWRRDFLDALFKDEEMRSLKFFANWKIALGAVIVTDSWLYANACEILHKIVNWIAILKKSFNLNDSKALIELYLEQNSHDCYSISHTNAIIFFLKTF